jgi:hypothetical protein
MMIATVPIVDIPYGLVRILFLKKVNKMNKQIKEIEKKYGVDLGAKDGEQLTEFLERKGYKSLADMLGNKQTDWKTRYEELWGNIDGMFDFEQRDKIEDFIESLLSEQEKKHKEERIMIREESVVSALEELIRIIEERGSEGISIKGLRRVTKQIRSLIDSKE